MLDIVTLIKKVYLYFSQRKGKEDSAFWEEDSPLSIKNYHLTLSPKHWKLRTDLDSIQGDFWGIE